jgi:hypothetical protein
MAARRGYRGRIASIHRVAEKVCSRKVGFRHTEFSETQDMKMRVASHVKDQRPFQEACVVL